jgi:hypothetical protein
MKIPVFYYPCVADWFCGNLTTIAITLGIILVLIWLVRNVSKEFIYKVAKASLTKVNDNPLYFWTSFWTLFGLFFGLIILGLLTRVRDINFGIITIWAAAYFLLGALVGCIFGVPKAVSEHPAATNTNKGNNIGNIDAEEKRAIKAKKSSTNLTDVSDWLSKVVLGAGLVQLYKIPGFVLHVAAVMSPGIILEQGENSKILCAGIVVYYTSFGLIAGYFIMRAIFIKFMET